MAEYRTRDDRSTNNLDGCDGILTRRRVQNNSGEVCTVANDFCIYLGLTFAAKVAEIFIIILQSLIITHVLSFY